MTIKGGTVDASLLLVHFAGNGAAPTASVNLHPMMLNPVALQGPALMNMPIIKDKALCSSAEIELGFAVKLDGAPDGFTTPKIVALAAPYMVFEPVVLVRGFDDKYIPSKPLSADSITEAQAAASRHEPFVG